MTRRIFDKLAIVTLVAAVVAASGFSGLPAFTPLAEAGGGSGTKPTMTSSLVIPSMPIVAGQAGSDLGYLPAAVSASTTGAATVTVPIEVPEGRMGMAPHLSLVYSSNSGNGPLGVGWTLSGLSSISRCRQTLSTEGVVNGVHLTDFSTTPEAERDRFCLDGQKLIAINGKYGENGTEYRTEQDTYQKILSVISNPGDTAPAWFTATAPDGTVRTYTSTQALVTPAVATAATYGTVPGGMAPVPVEWLLSSETDSAGNSIQYNYSQVHATAPVVPVGDGLEGVQIQLSSIDYTNCLSNACVYGTAVAYRHVNFNYANRPDQEFSWQAGVKSQLLQRLTNITMSAPDPATTVPVWEYNITYVSSSFSQRSLLHTVQRCAVQGPTGKTPGAAGDCTWSKTFSYTTASSTPIFAPAANVAAAPTVEIAPVVWAGGGAQPENVDVPQAYVKVLDADGDGVDDVLFQPGETASYDAAVAASNNSGSCSIQYPPGSGYGVNICNYPVLLPLPFPELLLLGKRGAASAVSPLAQSYDVSTDYGGDYSTYNNTMTGIWGQGSGSYDASGNWHPENPNAFTAGGVPLQSTSAGWGNLENIGLIDMDGDGHTSIFMKGDLTAANGQSDGNCTGRILNWGPRNDQVGVGFNDRGVGYPYDSGGAAVSPYTTCEDLGWTALGYAFIDADGDGRADIARASNLGPYFGATAWSTTINLGANVLGGWMPATTDFTPNSMASGISSGCPFYVADLTGDGRSQIFGQTASLVPNAAAGAPVLSCNSTGTFSYSPFTASGSYATAGAGVSSLTTDTTQSMPDLTAGVPPVPGVSHCQSGPGHCAASAGVNNQVTLYYGDFNGDGLQDVIVANPVGVLSLRWNTGSGSNAGNLFGGFGPPTTVANTPWAVGTGGTPAHYKVVVTDVNHDGRADLVVFHDNPRAITMMLSNGDGSFKSMDIPNADPGLYTSEGWTTSVMGDFNGDGLLDIASVLGGTPLLDLNGNVVISSGTLQTMLQENTAMTPLPAMAAQPAPDLLSTVQDEGTLWNRDTVTYSSQWSDKPELSACPTYPQHCPTKGLIVVRSIASMDTAANSVFSAHAVSYSYENPVSDVRGRGFLGFRKVRVWDPTRMQQTITEYDNASESGTLLPTPLNNPYGAYGSSPTLFQPGYYAGVGHPSRVTTVTAIPTTVVPPGVPGLPQLPRMGSAQVNSRVVQTVYNNQLVRTHNLQTYVVQPCALSVLFQAQTDVALPCSQGAAPAVATSQWEQMVSMAANVTDPSDPTSDYIWGMQPTGPVLKRTTTISTIDAYGNVLAATDRSTIGAAKGTQVDRLANYNNLTNAPNWLIGQLIQSTVTVTEADPSVLPVTSQMQYTYYQAGDLPGNGEYGQLKTQQRYQEQVVNGVVQMTNGAPAMSLVSTTTLGRDVNGNVISVATQATGPDGVATTRQTNIEYDALWPSQPPERIFPSQSWVSASLCGNAGCTNNWTPSSWSLIHPAYGVVSATMDSNGVQTSTVYDDQGRPLKATPAAGAPTTMSYMGRPDSAGGINGMIVTTSTGGQTATNCTDAGGRTIQTTHLGFTGVVTTDSYVQYDALGRAIWASRPYPGACSTPVLPPAGTNYAISLYDGLDRVVQSVGPDLQPAAYDGTHRLNAPVSASLATTYAHAFFANSDSYSNGYSRLVSSTTTTTPPNGGSFAPESRTDTDMDGQVVETANCMTACASSPTTPNWLLTRYHHAPGGVDAVTLPSGATETTSYDSLGRAIGAYSPDGGTVTNIVYDGFDELTSSTHKESGAVTTIKYDVVGRITSRNTTEAGKTTGGAAFTYDTQPYGLGKLASATSSDNVSTVPQYDPYGRPTGMAEIVNGKTYNQGVTYDSEGRVSQMSYPATTAIPTPSGFVTFAAGMTLQNNYNAYEYLSGLSNETFASPMNPLWTVNSRNVDGTLAQATLSLGLSGLYSAVNLGTYAYSYVPSNGRLQETKYTASYTPTAMLAATPVMDLAYGFYPNGQVYARSDNVNHRYESYNYDAINRLTLWNLSTVSTPAPFQQYGYDSDGNLKTVSSFSAQVPSKTNGYGPLLPVSLAPGPAGGPHAVDTQTINGITSTIAYDAHGRVASNSAGRKLTYNDLDLPRTVTSGGATYTMQYDAFGNRAFKGGPNGAMGPDGKTVYIGGVFEQRTALSGTVTDVYKVPGVAQVEVNDMTGATNTLYTLADPLGSTTTVVQASTSFVTGTKESVYAALFYDPFGAHINSAGIPYAPSATFGDVHDGFTGQEHDDDLGLINFKGRMYDPSLGRFLSMDPHVTHPGFGQSWNRYSYVLNNPINLVDPTGFDEKANPDDTGGSGGDPGGGVATGTEDTVPGEGDHIFVNSLGDAFTSGGDFYGNVDLNSCNNGTCTFTGSDGVQRAFYLDGFAPPSAQAAPASAVGGFGVPPESAPAPGPAADAGSQFAAPDDCSAQNCHNLRGTSGGIRPDNTVLSPEWTFNHTLGIGVGRANAPSDNDVANKRVLNSPSNTEVFLGAVNLATLVMPGPKVAGPTRSLNAELEGAASTGGRSVSGTFDVVNNNYKPISGTYWRGDGRPPEIILAQGFQPKVPGSSVDIVTYVQTNCPSNFVSLTTDRAATSGFPGYLYKVTGFPQGGIIINVPQILTGADLTIFGPEAEATFVGGVAPDGIEFVGKTQ